MKFTPTTVKSNICVQFVNWTLVYGGGGVGLYIPSKYIFDLITKGLAIPNSRGWNIYNLVFTILFAISLNIFA